MLCFVGGCFPAVDVCFLVAGVCDCFRRIGRPEYVWNVEKVRQPVGEVVRSWGFRQRSGVVVARNRGVENPFLGLILHTLSCARTPVSCCP